MFNQRSEYLPRGTSLFRFLASLPGGSDQLVPVHQRVHAGADGRGHVTPAQQPALTVAGGVQKPGYASNPDGSNPSALR